MRNITPNHLKCGIASCPAIYRNTDGELIIIGERRPQVTGKLMTKGKVGANEDVIVISEKFFENLKTTAYSPADGRGNPQGKKR